MYTHACLRSLMDVAVLGRTGGFELLGRVDKNLAHGGRIVGVGGYYPGWFWPLPRPLANDPPRDVACRAAFLTKNFTSLNIFPILVSLLSSCTFIAFENASVVILSYPLISYFFYLLADATAHAGQPSRRRSVLPPRRHFGWGAGGDPSRRRARISEALRAPGHHEQCARSQRRC